MRLFTKEDWYCITCKVKTRAQTIFESADGAFSTALKSRIVSELTEQFAAEFLNAERAKNDSEPDLLINGTPVEIKVTRLQKTKGGRPTKRQTFMGGKYSKRPGEYVFLAWDEDTLDFHYNNQALTKDDWAPADGGRGTYYGTKYYVLSEEMETLA
jgi:hypothetical protein